MAKRKTGGRKKPPASPKASRSTVRTNGKRFAIRNSGREVWLYDDANRRRIRDAEALVFGGIGAGFERLAADGVLVGYSLLQDDDLDVEVHVGKPLGKAELATGRWLETQQALLRLPSGKLCIESNDASRIGPDEPTEKGARLTLPPGNYRLSLYRIDQEALDREGIAWSGPQEVIVLTKGGRKADAARDLLPFAARRDMDWVGRYEIRGKRAVVQVWFGDGLDTFVVNLDRKGAAKLGLAAGAYFRTEVPAAGVTLVSAFADSWKDAERLPLPAGISLGEYGFAAFNRLDDWDYAEALFCRRDRTETRIADAHLNLWLAGALEVLEAKPTESTGRALAVTDLAGKDAYYDEGFLSMVLSEVVAAVADLDDIRLPKTLELIDARMRKLGFAAQGDRSWQERVRSRSVETETSCRLYTGGAGAFAVLLLSAGCFEILFLSETADGRWIATGFADELAGRLEKDGNTRVALENLDEEELGDILTAHRESLGDADEKPKRAPKSADDVIAAFGRFLSAAFS